MQRRAVAVYVALFVLVGVAAGGLVATADTPEVSFDDPEHVTASGEAFDQGGQEYSVEISEPEEEGSAPVTTISWEEVQQQSETWGNDTTVTVDGDEWRVIVEGENATEFTLREELDRQAILEDDPDADNQTVERDDGEYVVVQEDGEDRLVPAEEYFPEPEERTHAAGDELDTPDRTVTVGSIAASGVTVEWEGPVTQSIEIEGDEEITIGDTDYVAHLRGTDTLVLSTDLDGYDAQIADIDQHEQRTQGLWRVTIVSFLSAVLVAGLAFIPSRY